MIKLCLQRTNLSVLWFNVLENRSTCMDFSSGEAPNLGINFHHLKVLSDSTTLWTVFNLNGDFSRFSVGNWLISSQKAIKNAPNFLSTAHKKIIPNENFSPDNPVIDTLKHQPRYTATTDKSNRNNWYNNLFFIHT